MPKYKAVVRRAALDDYHFEALIPSLTVYEDEPQDTGLLDSSGNTIMKFKDPIGFIHHD